MPITWYPLPFRVRVSEKTNTVPCYFIKENKGKDNEESSEGQAVADIQPMLDKDKISKRLFVNDVLRLHDSINQDEELHVTSVKDIDCPKFIKIPGKKSRTGSMIINLTDDTEKEEEPIVEDMFAMIGTLTVLKPPLVPRSYTKIYKKDKAQRREPYLDLLVAKEMAVLGKSAGAQGLHEGGFATLYKLMAGEPVECPLCLEVSSDVD